uniref:Transmembrane protein n=1 Tax=Psilocybe cubensis TaxID=181762 RepID=A0A8H8CMZ3_PSICU
MSNSFDSTALVLNPTTPLAYLPPSVAFEYCVATYIVVGTLAVLIWDFLNNLFAEYSLLTCHKVKFHSYIYYISRFAVLLFSATASTVIFQTSPVENCDLLSMFSIWMFFISVPSTSLLFFFRVRALYIDRRYLLCVFFFLWLSVLGGSLATSLSQGKATKIGPSAYCLGGSMKSYSSAVGTMVIINDTVVFLAISRYLANIAHEHEYLLSTKSLKTYVLGTDLPHFSRTFLQDGQLYYLTTIFFSFATTVVLNINSIPLAYRAVAGVPNAVLMNIMACRVYRNTRLGFYKEDTTQVLNTISTETTPPVFVESPFIEKSSPVSLSGRDILHDEMDITQFFKEDEHRKIGEATGKFLDSTKNLICIKR